MLGSGSPAWRGLRAGSLPFWDWRLLGQLRLLGQRQGVRLPVAALALGLASTCCNLTRPGRGRPCDAGHPCGIQAPLLQGRQAWLSLLPSVPSQWMAFVLAGTSALPFFITETSVQSACLGGAPSGLWRKHFTLSHTWRRGKGIPPPQPLPAGARAAGCLGEGPRLRSLAAAPVSP